jgi:endonuclease/exonuclease/phosphatase family metal-dependent hydrolase
MKIKEMFRCGLIVFVVGLFFAFAIVPAAMAESDKLAVQVMTRNMDAGTDFRYFFVEDFPTAMADTIGEVLNGGIPERAALIAGEIAAKKPDLVALQEVTTWIFDKSVLGTPESLELNQLALLMSALKSYGQHYRVAVVQELTKIDIPNKVSFADYNAILVRTDLPPGHLDVLGTETHLFDAHLDFLGYPQVQGWIGADVKIRGARFKFVTTHLLGAVAGDPVSFNTQEDQAIQLLSDLQATSLPIILTGDFNSDAEFPHYYPSDATPSYGDIIAANYIDAWEQLYPSNRGDTWPLFWEDGVIAPPGPIERIDLIFSKGPEAITIERTGTSPDSGTGFFAADHAGVVATFSLENNRPDNKKK